MAERPILEGGRGEGRSFESYSRVVAPIVTVFDGPKLPWIAMIGRLIRSAAQPPAVHHRCRFAKAWPEPCFR